MHHHAVPAAAASHAPTSARAGGTSGVAVARPVSAGGVQRVAASSPAQHAVHVPAAPSAAPKSAPAAAPPSEADPPVAVAAPPTPPGQAKKTDDRQAAPAVPPGQAKKNADPPAPTAWTPPGQAKKNDVPPAARTISSLPPGQAKIGREAAPTALVEPASPSVVKPSSDGAEHGKAEGKEK